MNSSKFNYRILLVSLIPSILLTGIFSSFSNTLYHNVKWISTKTFLKKGVIGANDFYFSRNALANGHLNLGCWHGHQEVIYKKYIAPTEIAFDFLLSDNSYVVFGFNKNANQFSGIRISLCKKFKDIYFISSDEGEFTYVEELNIPLIKPNRWNHIKILFGHDTIMLYLNGQFIKTVKLFLLQQQQIGFRGGSKEALIDNVVIHERNSLYVIRESFDNKNFYWFLSIFGFMVLFNFLVGNVLYRYFKNTSKQTLLLITSNLVLSILLSLFLLFDYCCYSKRYVPIIKTRRLMDKEKKYWLNADERSIVRQIKDRYADRGSKNNIRIIFIGTSQTWGAGARDETETFVNRIEKKLNSSKAINGRFECINAGISSYNSSKLLDLYINELLVLEPQIVVIILSNNDSDSVQFSSNLRRFADLNISKGIKTIFVLEANSIELTPDELMLHKFMRQVGQEKGVPILDLHRYLAQNYDNGFLWWDSAHLTSFGQKLAADFLFEKIAQETYCNATY